MSWEELVVFSGPTSRRTQRNKILTTHECEQIRVLVEYVYPKPEIPLPDEFTDIQAPKVLEFTYDEVSPDMSRIRMASRILRGGKIFQWRRLYAGKTHNGFRPYDAWRGSNGVYVLFIDPTVPLEKIPVNYCRRICGFSSCPGVYQCAAFGSYSQIELSSFLPMWTGYCSTESAKSCPMRQAYINGSWPKPSPDDPTVQAFQEWCKTRKGYGTNEIAESLFTGTK